MIEMSTTAVFPKCRKCGLDVNDTGMIYAGSQFIYHPQCAPSYKPEPAPLSTEVAAALERLDAYHWYRQYPQDVGDDHMYPGDEEIAEVSALLARTAKDNEHLKRQLEIAADQVGAAVATNMRNAIEASEAQVERLTAALTEIAREQSAKTATDAADKFQAIARAALQQERKT